MEAATARQRVYLTVPYSDLKFIRTMSHKMGWEMHRERKSGLERAIDDVRAGRVYEAESVEDLIRQLEA